MRIAAAGAQRTGLPPSQVRDVLDQAPSAVGGPEKDKAVTQAIHDSLIEEMCWFLDRREGRHYHFWLQAVGDVDRTAIEKTMGAVQAWAVRGELTKRKPRIWCGLTLAARKRGLLWGGSSRDDK